MRHFSKYLDWYTHVSHLEYDLRSSGIMHFKFKLDLGETDLSVNYVHGNPETAKELAHMYGVKTENVFISSEGASGQNSRIIRCLAERNREKTEAIVEYPTYEPLLCQVQEHFPRVKRLERPEENAYAIDLDELRKTVSEKTGLVVLTNPHAPSGAITDKNGLGEVMDVAQEFGFYVVCDEIYAEFDRTLVPTILSVDQERGIVTTSFTKAYGLGGLKLGITLANQTIVDELYTDTLNTVGNGSNIVQTIAAELLRNWREVMEEHKQRWACLKTETEDWLGKMGYEFFPSMAGVTYWVKLPLDDTYRWINEQTIPKHNLAAVPGAFFLSKNDGGFVKSSMIRLGLGSVDPGDSNLSEALRALQRSLDMRS